MLSGPAWAVDAADHLRGRPTLEAAPGVGAPRRIRRVTHEPPTTNQAWREFEAEAGGTWRSLWDLGTGVPLRLYGSGIPAPGTVGSAVKAAAFSRAVLARHVALLAPGAGVEDFVLVSNHLHGGIRTVAFAQQLRGLRVVGGQVSFRFKHDRLVVLASEALPDVAVDAAAAEVVTATAAAATVASVAVEQRARRWIVADFGAAVTRARVTGPVVWPLVASRGGARAVQYRVVWVVTVGTRSPLGLWDVYVDGVTERPVARRQRLRFGSGTVYYNAPERWPGSVRRDYPAPTAAVLVGAVPGTTDASGTVSWSGTDTVSVTARAAGTYVRAHNEMGEEAGAVLDLADTGQVTWNAAIDEFVDAQIVAFVHANVAKEFSRTLAPDLAWLDEELVVNVNIDSACNAVSDGNELHFFQSSNWCENTGRIADVVYHEFGHTLHFHSLVAGGGTFDEALSEGLADYMSATITGDSGMGRGFFRTNSPLRELDPPGSEAVWPDDIDDDSHETGLIFGGAMWDLRKALVVDLGEADGAALADRLFFAAMQRASDIPSSYVEILLADDDDGDVSNGTPHLCAIRGAFAAHGLTGEEMVVSGLGIGTPVLNGQELSIRVDLPAFGCASAEVDQATIYWELRSEPGLGEEIAMVWDASVFAASLPEVMEGEVIRYLVVLELSDGAVVRFPRNPADPLYETFVGVLETLYCIDFEHDPERMGWTHGLSAGTPGDGADDWRWGRPTAGADSGDPPAAYSGQYVFGNDLGGGTFNGLYQADKVNYALSPVIDAAGYDGVRLQYRRWLSVQDGAYDQATLYANDQPVWTNLKTSRGDVHHQDYEWRFHDVDLTDALNAIENVQLKFELRSNGQIEMGGWTLDDVCVMGWVAPFCGDFRLSLGEACDDGYDNSDTLPDACRSDCRPARCGDGVVDSLEECDDGNEVDTDRCTNSCELAPAKPGQGCGCRTQGRQGAGSGLPIIVGLMLAWVFIRRRP